MIESKIVDEILYLEQLPIEGKNIQLILEKSQSLLGFVDADINPSLYASLQLIIAKAQYVSGNIEESISILESILRNRMIIEKVILGKVLLSLGTIYQHSTQFAESIDSYLQAIEIFESSQYSKGLASAYTNVGITYRLLADYGKSLEFMDKGRRLFEEFGDELGVAANTGNIGNVYFGLNQYAKALEYQRQALSIHEKLHNLKGIANNCLTIGGVHLLSKEYDLADVFLQRAKEICVILKDKTGIMHAQSNIGILLEFQEKFEDAYALHNEVLEYSIEKGDKTGIATQYVNIGNLYANPANPLRDLSMAERYFQKAMQIHTKLNLNSEECSLHKQMSELYEQMNEWEKSLIHLKQYLEINQELISEDAQNKADLLDQRRRLDVIERDRLLQVARFQEQEKILHNILPNTIADRILDGEKNIVDHADDISIFFCDIADFTAMTSDMKPKELIKDLNTLFTEFDKIARKHKVEKIKTIGDSYMAVCGVPESTENHASRLAEFALEVLTVSHHFKIGAFPVQLRIGLHAGEAIAGVIGEDKYSYDLWGDTVNIASRMEHTGEKGKIQVSEYFKKLLDEYSQFDFVSRGETEIKGKGLMKTYFLHQSNNS